jgi:hypothetical protein
MDYRTEVDRLERLAECDDDAALAIMAARVNADDSVREGVCGDRDAEYWRIAFDSIGLTEAFEDVAGWFRANGYRG